MQQGSFCFTVNSKQKWWWLIVITHASGWPIYFCARLWQKVRTWSGQQCLHLSWRLPGYHHCWHQAHSGQLISTSCDISNRWKGKGSSCAAIGCISNSVLFGCLILFDRSLWVCVPVSCWGPGWPVAVLLLAAYPTVFSLAAWYCLTGVCESVFLLAAEGLADL